MFNWKILDLFADKDGVVKSARYFVVASDGVNTVETEGNCDIPTGEIVTSFDQITEAQVIDWVKKVIMQNGENPIELRLQEQLEVLKNQNAVKAPWVKTIYKPTL
jgi:hypothetical protein